jgi:hypothetical protein
LAVRYDTARARAHGLDPGVQRLLAAAGADREHDAAGGKLADRAVTARADRPRMKRWSQSDSFVVREGTTAVTAPISHFQYLAPERRFANCRGEIRGS